jgi:hypothetical protein
MPVPEVIELFIRPLNQAGIRYMVTGGVAAILYGEPRLTNDINLVIATARGDAERLLRAFERTDYYAPPLETVRMELGRDVGGHFNILHVPTALRADVYSAGTDPLMRWGLGRRQVMSLGSEELPVAPIEYVILMKLQWLRQGATDRHLADIRGMLRLSSDLIAETGLEQWIERLGLEGEWRRVAGP